MSAETMRQALKDKLRVMAEEIAKECAERTDYAEPTLRVMQGRYLQCTDLMALIDETYRGLGQ